MFFPWLDIGFLTFQRNMFPSSQKDTNCVITRLNLNFGPKTRKKGFIEYVFTNSIVVLAWKVWRRCFKFRRVKHPKYWNNAYFSLRIIKDSSKWSFQEIGIVDLSFWPFKRSINGAHNSKCYNKFFCEKWTKTKEWMKS